MPVKLPTFYDEYQKALDEGDAAVFVGAGLSVPAGYVNWKELLREIADELELEIDKETDLIALAQYHVNQARGRGKLNQKLIEEFTKDSAPTENYRLLASLPLAIAWTTNYDHLLEDAFKAAHKRIDRKVVPQDLAHTTPKRDVVLYKMHGDIDRPDDAVLTKDDYERYNDRRQLFSMQLQGDLISKTFLFLGFSFTDPNISYILGRVRSLVGENRRPHYWVAKDVAAEPSPDPLEIKRQRHRIEDLKTYGIRTVLIQDYRQITELLKELHRRIFRKNVFVSGSAVDFGPLGRSRIEALSRRLGATLIEKGFNVVSGMGLGIGDAISMGAIETVYRRPGAHLEERAVIRPFPQVDPMSGDRNAIWTRYREEMIERARSVIYLLGNKEVGGTVVPASGMLEEFEIATARGIYPIPVGATGFEAAQIWQKVWAELNKYYGDLGAAVEQPFKTLNDRTASDDKLLDAIVRILKTIAPK